MSKLPCPGIPSGYRRSTADKDLWTTNPQPCWLRLDTPARLSSTVYQDGYPRYTKLAMTPVELCVSTGNFYRMPPAAYRSNNSGDKGRQRGQSRVYEGKGDSPALDIEPLDPFLIEFHQERADQGRTGLLIREDRHHPRSAFDLLFTLPARCSSLRFGEVPAAY